MMETAQPHAVISTSPVPSETIRVLLIDDNEDDAMITQAMLAQVRGVSFEAEWASTYQQGLEKLKENSHAICLLDYSLGQKTGLNVLGEALKFGCHVPIIMMTGAADREVDLQAIRLGAADYVIKGEANPALLERVIRHAQERRKAADEREQLTQQLIESSRRLGMAEVATDVLHNIGNVMNSLNVSAGLIVRHVRDMPVRDVQRTAALFATHHEDLGTFLTKDTKGQRVPEFLTQLGNHLHEQHDQVCQNLETIITQIDHVKDIIAAQEDLARTSGIYEPVLLKDLIEKALKIHAPGFEKDHITISRDYVDLPQIIIDKQQVLQILANLIRNAKNAIRQNDQGPHNLTIRIQPHPQEETRICIQVIDTGIGIPTENLHRIFAQSFSKKTPGQGTGLHSNALAAKNLGGSLTASSKGQGRGASFTLELPVKFMEIPT